MFVGVTSMEVIKNLIGSRLAYSLVAEVCDV